MTAPPPPPPPVPSSDPPPPPPVSSDDWKSRWTKGKVIGLAVLAFFAVGLILQATGYESQAQRDRKAAAADTTVAERRSDTNDPELLARIREAAIATVPGCDVECRVIERAYASFRIEVYVDDALTTTNARVVCEMVTFNVAGRGDPVAVWIGEREVATGMAGEPCDT